MIEVLGYNFRSSVYYDYDTVRDCESNGCDIESICRCSKIENCRVLLVNVSEMVSELICNYYDNSKASIRQSTINSILGGITKEIDIYTIDRILRINKVYDTSVWEIQTVSGYYGDEISSIILQDKVSKKIESEISHAFSLLYLNERIEYLLNLEYGYILPELKNCNWSIISIDRDNILYGSDTQIKNVSGGNYEWYSDKNYQLIRAIVLERKDEFRLIDGYHRCFASENKTIKVLKASQS